MTGESESERHEREMRERIATAIMGGLASHPTHTALQHDALASWAVDAADATEVRWFRTEAEARAAANRRAS